MVVSFLIMPVRKDALSTNSYYHVFNRRVDKGVLFSNSHQFLRFKAVCAFYKYFSATVSDVCDLKKPGSAYKEVLKVKKVFENLNDGDSLSFKQMELKQKWQPDFKVEILAYAFMPTHYHFFLKQLVDGGIADFIKRIQSSYTLYLNRISDRSGVLWQNRFKNVRVQSDEQFLYLSKYIHVNCKDLDTVKSVKDIANYPYSSYQEYLGIINEEDFLSDPSFIINEQRSVKQYKNFVETDVENLDQYIEVGLDESLSLS